MKRKLIVNPFFAWFDFWIGFFYDTNKQILYLCPLPMCVISFRFEEVKLCPECNHEMKKEAHDTGDGWAFMLTCYNEYCFWHEHLGWPFKKETATPKDIRDLGFRIV